MDVAILYGQNKKLRRNLTAMEKLSAYHDQTCAAHKLSANLASVDILDLIETVSMFHDLITEQKEERIGFTMERTLFRDEYGRKALVKETVRVLSEQFNEEQYRNPDILPKTLKALILKFKWLSIEQPLQNVWTRNYLNWETVTRWIYSVCSHQKHLNAYRLLVDPMLLKL